MRECNRCGVPKAESGFYRSKKSICKECIIINQREYRRNNPKIHRDSVKRWRQKNPDKVKKSYSKYNKKRSAKQRTYYLQQNYGISQIEYNNLLKLQSNVCAICGQLELKGRKKFLSVDHDHMTGMVRGLLCNRCNTLIGIIGNDEYIIGNLLDYLAGIVPSKLSYLEV